MSRRLKQKTVAEARAPVFARPAQIASTPTGLDGVRVGNDKEGVQSWPGPFSTARDIIAKREDAKLRREERLANPESDDNDEMDEEEELDEFDIKLKELKWSPKKIRNKYQSLTPCLSLAELCVKAYTTNINNITSDVLSRISDESKDQLLLAIARNRCMTPQVALSFVVEDSATVILPECSLLSDHTFDSIFDKVLPHHNNNNSSSGTGESSINIIQLMNAGHGFGDAVADRLAPKIAQLEVFQVTGLYRLNDEALARLLIACQHSLRHFDVSSNYRLSSSSLQALRLDMLSSLTLDFCNHLTDEHLSLLVNSLTSPSSSFSSSSSSSSAHVSSLEHLSLVGLNLITDQAITTLLAAVGPTLQSLNLAQCGLLTDTTLVTIRTHCSHLRDLDLSMIFNFTTFALIGLFIDTASLSPTAPPLDPDADSDAVQMDPSLYDTNNINNYGTYAASSPLSEGSIGMLESVNLKGVEGVTDDVLLHLVKNSQLTLKQLNLNGCYQLTSKSCVILMTYSNPNLHTLDLSFIRKVSEDSVGALVEICSQLSTLTVWGCSQLTGRFYYGIREGVTVVGKPDWM